MAIWRVPNGVLMLPPSQDVLKFGFSSREYVILHEKSDAAVEEDVSPVSAGGSAGTPE